MSRDDLRELSEDATPGPWSVGPEGFGIVPAGAQESTRLGADSRYIVALVNWHRDALLADTPSVEPAGQSYSVGNPTNVTEVELSDGLDAAWREAEAALPEGWRMDGLHNSSDGWFAVALAETPVQAYVDTDYCDTPAAALRALAAEYAHLPTQASDSPEKPT